MAVRNSTVRPKLADAYFDWEAQGRTTPPPSAGSIVAVPATADWGPANVCVLLDNYDEYVQMFGDTDTALRRAVFGAFKGQGVGGKGGAGAVLAYRQAAASAAPATVTLDNTSAADGITLTALYPGTRGNRLRATVQPGTAGGTTDLILLDGSLVVETYTFASTDLAGVVAEINRSSDWVAAAVDTAGTALASVSASAATGGADGSTLTGTEWTATFAAYDRERWSIFAPYGLTDATIRASVVAWIQQRRTLGARSWAVLGGAAGEALTTANTRSVAINDYDVINLGMGTLTLTDENRSVSTAEFVTRYAGARAWRGESRDDIYVRFADVELASGATLTQQEQALDGGTVVFSRDTNLDAPVFIREAVTTYTDDSLSTVDSEGNPTHPVALYKRIKNVAIQHGIELEVLDWWRSGDVAGELPNDEKAREQILGRVRDAYQNRETARIVQPGWTVTYDGPQDDDDDAVFYLHGFHPTRSLRQMFNRARMG